MRKITFENLGQDFTTWIIDANGKIVESLPVFYPIWNGCTVKWPDELANGKNVVLTTASGNLQFIDFPIKSIEPFYYEL